MLVRLLVSRVTVAGAQSPGDKIDVPPKEAARMIEAGQAAPVRGKKPQNTSKRARPEKAEK